MHITQDPLGLRFKLIPSLNVLTLFEALIESFVYLIHGVDGAFISLLPSHQIIKSFLLITFQITIQSFFYCWNLQFLDNFLVLAF